MDYISPLTPAPGVIKDGHVARYVNTNIRGEPTNAQYGAIGRLYEYVPNDRAKVRHKMLSYSKHSSNEDQFITWKDTVLMEAPEQIIPKEAEWLNKQSSQQRRGISEYVREDIQVNTSSKPIYSF
jgi:hypothetical protein